MGSTQISVAQAKAEVAALVARAEGGEDIIVTRNGRPVGRMTRLAAVPEIHRLIAQARTDDLALLTRDTKILDHGTNGATCAP